MADIESKVSESRRTHRARRETAAAGAKRSRAGRNLPVAISVGLLLAAVVIGSLVFYPWVFVALVTIAAGVGVWEVDHAFRAGRICPPFPPVLLSIALVPLAYVWGAEALAIGFAASVALILLWRSVGPKEDAARDVAGGVFIVAYVPLLCAIASLMVSAPDGVGRVLTFILVTVASDTGGFAVGVFKGRSPMAPSLSPKKSWEGFAGSVGTSALVGAAAVFLLLDGRWWVGLLVGAVAAVFATVGDLAESSIKRDVGIKDMGNVLPGHGGVMDRLDSMVVTAPVCWVLLSLFV
ncbi:MAG: phosphatidate cytidylyltransferase [Ornithinimicrobium sp.]|uniref:phosphatidate cytidylyltransferase n=1 Tax=Ornithinimicrobium sp. TaxID=1977084 RepID=UPI0026DFA291|nr:phosphatidate cytidylyltransferase [Ornithinimicrobium sp.]MDO5739316.1 phosphatidate cytidylyltransferase [Ornithinimicrobium sp.]